MNILSAGLGGRVDRLVADSPRMLTPTAAYFWASVRALAMSERAPISCVVELAGARTERRIEAWSIAICNGSTFGSGMRIAPMAAVDDGRLEVVALSPVTKLGLVLLSRKIYAGTHLGDPNVTHLRGDRVELSAARGAHDETEKILLDVDGEPLGELPVTIELVPGALRMRV